MNETEAAYLQRVHDHVERYLRWQLGGNADLAAEAAQETVLRLLQAHGRGAIRLPLLTFRGAERIAHWTLAELYRRQRGRRAGMDQPSRWQRPALVALPVQLADRRAPRPDQEAMFNEALARLEQLGVTPGCSRRAAVPRRRPDGTLCNVWFIRGKRLWLAEARLGKQSFRVGYFLSRPEAEAALLRWWEGYGFSGADAA